ncbi:MAG: hypothetical protein ABIJ52_07685 [Pseudomonadota bacterium]|nr:hypothetical protein [Pseudomonadota bacterium]MBU1397671.1 hypothetical protein [Pseudomonadota bacterium]MBU1571037.1 hypothetical protein [Pseudomonadota bacterium]
MIIILRLIFFFIALIAGPAFAGDDKEIYIRESRLLEEELKLSRKPDIYFIFNLKGKMVYIKSRGISLKELPIKDFNFWGSPVSVSAYRVREKSTFIEPEREMIKPGESKKNEKYKVDAFEVTDMPSRYTVILDGGIAIYIKPLTEGIFSGISNFSFSSVRFLTRPILMLWNVLKGKPYTAIDIVLDKNDAMAFYWSLSENSNAIVNTP